MLKKTALYEQHQKLGATFFHFADWQMPLHYGSQLNEHHLVRNDAAVFDVSHMAIIDITGSQSKDFLRYLLANDIQKINTNQALYTCMLNNDGGIKDDLIVYCLSSEHYRLVVNASMQEKDLKWIKQHASSYDIQISWQNDLAILAVQGPKAWERMQSVFSSQQKEATLNLKPFSFASVNEWIIAYTGYTGEAGMEIMLPNSQVNECWDKLMQAGIKPAGLGARDSLRLEAGFNLYGQDMDESTSPLASNLTWTVDFKDKEREFIGKGALEQQLAQGIDEQLVGVVLMEKGVCRAGMKVLLPNQHGVLTSGGFSPTLSCGIGLARLPQGNYVMAEVDIRGKQTQVKIIKPPFVKKGKANFNEAKELT